MNTISRSHRTATLAACALLLMIGCAAKPQVEVKAASRYAMPGWTQMQPRGDEAPAVWVGPAHVTSAFIAHAEHAQDNRGHPAIVLELTDAGATRMKHLSSQSIGKPVAVFLDGELVSAPIVQGQLGRRIMIVGVTEEEADRVVAAFARR